MRSRPLRLWLPFLAVAGAAGWRHAPATAHSSGPVQRPVAGATPAPASGAAPAPQLGRVVYVYRGDLWVKALLDGEARRLTQDGLLITVHAGRSDRRELSMPSDSIWNPTLPSGAFVPMAAMPRSC